VCSYSQKAIRVLDQESEASGMISVIHGGLSALSAVFIGVGVNSLVHSGMLAIGIAIGVIALLSALWVPHMEMLEHKRKHG
jgi:hypothetical protein